MSGILPFTRGYSLQHLTPKILKDLLEKATGESQHVVAVNIDIRGFSAFCERVESADVVLFIREIYRKLVDGYFPNAPFVKPTGDGLLIVLPYQKETLKEIATNALEACVRAHDEFPSFCIGEEMINFKVPQKIGIGLSRGAVSRIIANGWTLDYSGRVLNLASRLMNLARPSGVVFDTDFLQSLPPEIKSTFSKAKVWLWGIAEREPIEIYYSKAYGTKIPTMYKKRLDVRKWHSQEANIVFGVLESQEKKGYHWLRILEREPVDPDEIMIYVRLPGIRGTLGAESLWTLSKESYDYEFSGGQPKVKFNLGLLVQKLRDLGFSGTDKCRFVIRYV
jgi:class 3 adenylate cyclase